MHWHHDLVEYRERVGGRWRAAASRVGVPSPRQRPVGRGIHVVAATLGCLLLVACGAPAAQQQDSVAAQPATPTTTTPAASSPTPPMAGPSDGPRPSTADSATQSSGASDRPTTYNGPWPPGQRVGVIGVSYDSWLNMRAEPGLDQEVVARLASTEDDMAVVTGTFQSVDDRGWIEVRWMGTTGWVDGFHVAIPGGEADWTEAVVRGLGETPTADTTVELGRLVAEWVSSPVQEPSVVALVEPPDKGSDGLTVTHDVAGLADDAVWGVRLRVTARPLPDGGVVLDSVHRRYFCTRAVTPDGSCV